MTETLDAKDLEEAIALLKWKYDALDDPEKARKLIPGTEVYTRIVGYYRPIANWNPGKAEEYKDRRDFTTRSFDGKGNRANQQQVLESVGQQHDCEAGSGCSIAPVDGR